MVIHAYTKKRFSFTREEYEIMNLLVYMGTGRHLHSYPLEIEKLDICNENKSCLRQEKGGP